MDRHLFDILWKSTATSTARSRSRSFPRTDPPPPMPCSAAVRRAWRASASTCSATPWISSSRTCRLSKSASPGFGLQRGGVGFYPTSGSPFVHLDTGSIRHWPRMTHDQLARVFPDGRTVHVPSDGQTAWPATSWRSPTSKNAIAAKMPQPEANRACWPPCSRAESNDDEEEAARRF